MGSLSTLTLALMQVQGLEPPALTFNEWMAETWRAGGPTMYPLAACALLGLIIIVWKLFDLTTKASRTRSFLREIDGLIAERKITDALAIARDSNTPAGRILAAGLERHDEGTDRVTKAIENVGLIEMANLESNLVWLATVSNVAPLLGFLGTVLGMINAFNAIELAGEVDATLVASGIKEALVTTAAGLAIAIPVNIMHNYFVTQVDRLVIDMEESAQKMVDAIHGQEKELAAAR